MRDANRKRFCRIPTKLTLLESERAMLKELGKGEMSKGVSEALEIIRSKQLTLNIITEIKL